MTDVNWNAFTEAASPVDSFIAGRQARMKENAFAQDRQWAAQDRQLAMQDRQKGDEAAAKKQQLEITHAAADYLGNIASQSQDPQQVLAKFDEMTPVLSQVIGATPEQLAPFRQAIAANPIEAINAIKGAAKRELEYMNLGGGYGVAIDKASGAKVAEYNAPYLKLGPNETAVPSPLYGQQPAGGVAPSGAAPATARGVRNNNPLNITTLPNGQWAGQAGADGKFAVFATPQAGFAAADKNLQAYAKRGINTIEGVVGRWAPDGVDGNNVSSYAGTVARDLGIDPKAPIDLANPQVRQRLLMSMSKVELGGTHPGLPTLQGTPKPTEQWKQIDPGRQQNTATGEIKGIPGSAQDQKRADARLKQAQALQTEAAKAQLVLSTIRDARNFIGKGETGIIGAAASKYPGTRAYDLARKLETVKANLSFDTLAEMRRNSPTGGALGAVSDREIALLGAAVASIDQGQSEPELRKALRQIETHYANVLKAQSDALKQPASPPRQGANRRLDFGGNNPQGQLPPQAVKQLKPNAVVTFANGQQWTLRNGKPVRVK